MDRYAVISFFATVKYYIILLVCLCILLLAQEFGGFVKLFDRFDHGLVQLQYLKF